MIPLYTNGHILSPDGCVLYDEFADLLRPMIERAVYAGYDSAHLQTMLSHVIDEVVVWAAVDIELRLRGDHFEDDREWTDEEVEAARNRWELPTQADTDVSTGEYR